VELPSSRFAYEQSSEVVMLEPTLTSIFPPLYSYSITPSNLIGVPRKQSKPLIEFYFPQIKVEKDEKKRYD